MRKAQLFLVFAIISLFGLQSCSVEDLNEFLYAPGQMAFMSTESTQMMTISASEKPTASVKQDWIILGAVEQSKENASQYTLKVSVQANPDNEKRKGAITITSGRYTSTVEVLQLPTSAQ